MKLLMTSLATAFVMFYSCSANAAETDKTLVAWVVPGNPAHRGGSALTIQSGDQFDGIVFGELQASKWMAGSNYHKRTERTQDKYVAETAGKKKTGNPWRRGIQRRKAPRCLRLTRICSPSAMIRWDFSPLIWQTMPTPQASCSKRGS